MRYAAYAVISICAALVTGCVAEGKYQKLQADLVEARKASAQTVSAFEDFKKKSAADTAALQQELTNATAATDHYRQALDDANTRAAEMEQRQAQTTAALTEASTKVTALEDDKQQLLSGTTTAQEEIARLQKRAGELDAQTARANDLEKRLSEREQEIGTLRQATADREALSTKVAVLSGELGALKEDSAKTKQERDQLLEAQGKLQGSLEQQQERLKAEAAEKERLEQERAAKEAEIQRLTKAHEDLTNSLQAEIAKGDIKIKQVADRLTINMVERVLFDSGRAQVKPAGLKVLKQVSDVLKTIKDKQILIEGHTDNVPIGVKLRDRFPTNWELSTTRATSVVRYLIEQGGLDSAALSAVGHADTRPVAGNDTEEGRTANRRIEIVLYPKDLSEIASQMKP